MFVFGTADDVFGMAVRIEENGHAFYSAAADMAQDPRSKELFRSLADMEAGHILAFKSLRSSLPGSFPSDAVWDPEGLAESYLQAAADTHIFTAQTGAERLKKITEPIQVLEMAIQFEKDSVAFFLGIKAVLPDPAGKQEIDQLISAEMDHVTMLVNARRLLLSGGSAAIK